MATQTRHRITEGPLNVVLRPGSEAEAAYRSAVLAPGFGPRSGPRPPLPRREDAPEPPVGARLPWRVGRRRPREARPRPPGRDGRPRPEQRARPVLPERGGHGHLRRLPGAHGEGAEPRLPRHGRDPRRGARRRAGDGLHPAPARCRARRRRLDRRPTGGQRIPTRTRSTRSTASAATTARSTSTGRRSTTPSPSTRKATTASSPSTSRGRTSARRCTTSCRRREPTRTSRTRSAPDPRPGPTSFLGWYSSRGGEIGDIPMAEAGGRLDLVMQEVQLADGSGTVPIQLMWSNAVGGPEGPIPKPHPPQ